MMIFSQFALRMRKKIYLLVHTYTEHKTDERQMNLGLCNSLGDQMMFLLPSLVFTQSKLRQTHTNTSMLHIHEFVKLMMHINACTQILKNQRKELFAWRVIQE